MMDYYGYSGFYSWWPMSIMMILFWALIIIGIVWIVKSFKGRGWDERGDRPRDRALDILKERYAKGEIDEKEFQKKKEDLMK